MEWWQLPAAPAFLVGALLGGAFAQLVLTAIWRRAIPSADIAPVVAAMFTRQALAACGHAPQALPFLDVLSSIAVAAILAAYFVVRAPRTERRFFTAKLGVSLAVFAAAVTVGVATPRASTAAPNSSTEQLLSSSSRKPGELAWRSDDGHIGANFPCVPTSQIDDQSMRGVVLHSFECESSVGSFYASWMDRVPGDKFTKVARAEAVAKGMLDGAKARIDRQLPVMGESFGGVDAFATLEDESEGVVALRCRVLVTDARVHLSFAFFKKTPVATREAEDFVTSLRVTTPE